MNELEAGGTLSGKSSGSHADVPNVSEWFQAGKRVMNDGTFSRICQCNSQYKPEDVCSGSYVRR